MAARRAQNISEAKLKRLLEYNQRLREQLDVLELPFPKLQQDPMLPSVWGPIDKKDDPFAPTNSSGCCVVQ
ncbi:unnamed protein product [Cunninghamella blakesleeana]